MLTLSLLYTGTNPPSYVYRVSCEGELQVALGGLSAILSGLINHPDDDKRKAIKLNNDKFQADIGQFGCEVLYAAGFKLKHFRVSPSSLCLVPLCF